MGQRTSSSAISRPAYSLDSGQSLSARSNGVSSPKAGARRQLVCRRNRNFQIGCRYGACSSRLGTSPFYVRNLSRSGHTSKALNHTRFISEGEEWRRNHLTFPLHLLASQIAVFARNAPCGPCERRYIVSYDAGTLDDIRPFAGIIHVRGADRQIDASGNSEKRCTREPHSVLHELAVRHNHRLKKSRAIDLGFTTRSRTSAMGHRRPSRTKSRTA